MFRVHMLPAFHGDCLWVEFGRDDDPKVILIDAGTPSTWPALKAKLLAERARRNGKLHIELFVVTHVDADHIGGALKLIGQLAPLKMTIGGVWFNGYLHLDNQQVPPTDVLGPKQGEQLSALIKDAGLRWNAHFDRRAVMVPDTGPLPEANFAGLRLTLLSPSFAALQALKPEWEKEVRKAGLVPGDAYEVVEDKADSDILGDEPVQDLADIPFRADTAKANGSSIAFLAECEGKVAFFGADAHADVIHAALKRGPLKDKESLALAGMKVPHHGSKANTDVALVKALPARHYLVSSNGNQFEHPDPEAIARIAVHGPAGKQLDFNYKTAFNKQWDSAARKAEYKYATKYGKDGEGLVVDL